MKKEHVNTTEPLFLNSKKEILEIEKLLTNKLSSVISKHIQGNKKLEAIMSLLPDGLIFVSNDGTISLCNSFAKKILNVDNLDLIGKHFLDIFQDNIFGISIKEALASLRRPKTILLALTTNESIKDIEVYINRHEDIGILISLKDRAPYKQLETSLQRYQQLSELGEVVATIAHEIRNPLTGISGYASLLKSELTDPKHVHMTEAIIEGALSLNSLLTDILEYSKPEPLVLKPTNLFKLIKKELILLSAGLTHVSCSLEESNQNIIKSVDEKKLKTVIWNLIINAAEASPKQSIIKIIITNEGHIKISDNGKGISRENMKNLFTPFFTTKTHGTGIGLSKAYKIIRAHGGELLVQPNSPQGTSFIIKLPR